MGERGRIRVGTSGFGYANWRGTFYPERLPRREWLAHYASVLPSVEINATFHRLEPEHVFRAWAEQTPTSFRFSVKAFRGITHFRKLRGAEAQLERFLGSLAGLGERCGPIVFQLQPRFDLDLARLERFLGALPPGRRYAFEFRDPRWHVDSVYLALGRAGAAFCLFELPELRSPRLATTDFVYVRLHGRDVRYRGPYGRVALESWARWLAARREEGLGAYVYFDNTDEAAHAVWDAQRLDRMLEDRSPS